MIKLLERIIGINNENLSRLEDEGYEFIARTFSSDVYKKGNNFILYNPRTDEIIKQFTTRK